MARSPPVFNTSRKRHRQYISDELRYGTGVGRERTAVKRYRTPSINIAVTAARRLQAMNALTAGTTRCDRTRNAFITTALVFSFDNCQRIKTPL